MNVGNDHKGIGRNRCSEMESRNKTKESNQVKTDIMQQVALKQNALLQHGTKSLPPVTKQKLFNKL